MTIHDRIGGVVHDFGFKFGNTAALEWRPLAGTGWVTALAVNADDQIVLGAVTLGVVVDPTAGTVGIGDVDGGAVVIEVEADGDVQIGDQTGDLVIDIDDAGNLGFFATTPAVAQQTLTAIGDAARLTELLTALDALGLVVDSTTPGAESAAAIAIMTTPGTSSVTIPTSSVALRITCGGAGGGGGAGNGTPAYYSGGGGGAGGALSRVTLDAAALRAIAATISVTVGAGGAGATTAVAAGSAGGASSVSINSDLLVLANGGAGGAGAMNTPSIAPAAAGGTGEWYGSPGGIMVHGAAGAAPAPTGSFAGAGGGAGGGRSSTGAHTGGAGGVSAWYSDAGAAAGGAHHSAMEGEAGTDGGAAITDGRFAGRGGGGGGGCNGLYAAGDGGAGQSPGGGGGGGGSTKSETAGHWGSGGTGGDGLVILEWI